MIRALLALVAIAALGWSGYWVWGARALAHNTEAWLAERRTEGWVAEAERSTVRGFPNRFDLTLDALELADPGTGLSWSAPFFQILALSYRPNHVIAVWPPEQTVSTPLERIAVASEDFRGSLRVEATRELALRDATFVAEGVTLASNAGWTAEVGTGRLAVRRRPVSDATYEIGIETLGLVPSEAARRALDRTGRLPDEVETLRLDAEIAFDRPWDRTAIEEARPQPTAIDLRELRAAWGRLDLRAAGALSIAPDGVPTGEIAVRAVNWREMLELAVAAGTLPGGVATALERGLDALAGASGSPDTLDATLTFRDGGIFYAFIPLGPAPRLILR